MKENDRQILTALSEIVHHMLQGRKSTLDMSSIPASDTHEVQDLRSTVATLITQYNDSYDFIQDLSKGKLETVPPPHNSFVSPLKQLHANLLHLTWQIDQISKGDLDQKVSFSGDFSDAINRMIESLREKQRISALNESYLAELQELNANKDKLFSIIAHDLKNPFSGLLNLSDMLLADAKDKNYDTIEEYANLLKSFSLQGYKLLINLLEWAKLQSNTVMLNLEPLDLDDVVQQSMALVQPVAQQKGIALRCCYPDQLSVMADSNMLQTVLRNLLSNAVKFTPSGGLVTISAEKKTNSVEILVQDNGVGIRPENLKRLFRIDDPFRSNGTSNEFGSGLGLILCMDLLKKMNSQIRVESEVGKGSTFRFSLPVA